MELKRIIDICNIGTGVALALLAIGITLGVYAMILAIKLDREEKNKEPKKALKVRAQAFSLSRVYNTSYNERIKFERGFIMELLLLVAMLLCTIIALRKIDVTEKKVDNDNKSKQIKNQYNI